MILNYNNLTFIIVTFKSESIIENCIDSLPLNVPIIIIENSNNKAIKQYLEKKYRNLTVILEDNKGMGASNNIGIKLANTNFAFVINPDIEFGSNTFDELIIATKNIDDFAILSPISHDKKFPNYKVKDKKELIKDDYSIEVEEIDGFSMLIDKSKFQDSNFFDENFFLYLENNDLCLRKKNQG